MPTFKTFDGLEMSYLDEGRGPWVLLLHGFAADAQGNWVAPGIRDAIVAAGFRTLAPDARGHGASAKPHDPAAYGDDAMVKDVSAFIDQLGADRVHVVGYSMGAMTTRMVGARDPRVRSMVLGGIGARMREATDEQWQARAGSIADALEASDPSTVASPEARAFRAFADSTGADRLALAAIQRSRRSRAPESAPSDVPVLVVCGKDDVLAGAPDELAKLYPNGRAVTTPGDHLSAVAEPALCEAIVSFLREQALD